MRRSDYWICCWPGLSPAWRLGQPLGLLAAVAFSALLNLAIVATLVWPQLLGPQIPQGLWLAVGLVWIGSSWYEFRRYGRLPDDSQHAFAGDDALFIQAQSEYLKGNWEEAEWILRQRLSTCHRDVESRLLLVTVYRRQGQRQFAFDQLQILKRFDGSREWVEEMDREARLLDSADATLDAPAGAAESAKERVDSTAESELRKMNTQSARRAA